MELGTIKQLIGDYIKELSFGDLRNLTDETLIFHDGFFDSMGLVSLITFLEESTIFRLQKMIWMKQISNLLMQLVPLY